MRLPPPQYSTIYGTAGFTGTFETEGLSGSYGQILECKANAVYNSIGMQPPVGPGCGTGTGGGEVGGGGGPGVGGSGGSGADGGGGPGGTSGGSGGGTAGGQNTGTNVGTEVARLAPSASPGDPALPPPCCTGNKNNSLFTFGTNGETMFPCQLNLNLDALANCLTAALIPQKLGVCIPCQCRAKQPGSKK